MSHEMQSCEIWHFFVQVGATLGISILQPIFFPHHVILPAHNMQIIEKYLRVNSRSVVSLNDSVSFADKQSTGAITSSLQDKRIAIGWHQ